MDNFLLSFKNVSVSLNRKVILNHITFEIREFQVVGLVGPNGAGKTTLLNTILGSIRNFNGDITIRRDIELGISVSRQGFFNDMTVWRNIELYKKIAGFDKTLLDQYIDAMRINFLDKRFGQLSAGMKQKVSLCLAFMKNFKLILLDEPTNHLDVDALISLRNLIQNRKDSGSSIIIASPILTDLERVCDRAIFLKNGRIVLNENVSELIQKYSSLELAYLRN
jgi:ABC-2 type transport system ATP-binding protein